MVGDRAANGQHLSQIRIEVHEAAISIDTEAVEQFRKEAAACRIRSDIENLLVAQTMRFAQFLDVGWRDL